MMKYDECRFINFFGGSVGQRGIKTNLCDRVKKTGNDPFQECIANGRVFPCHFFEGGLGETTQGVNRETLVC